MLDFIYELLGRIGYTHPVHPSLTHLPVGLVMGAFLFALGALALKRSTWGQTARHCTVLALLALPPTIVLGVADWHHHYAGAWLFPIIMKLWLVGLLLILLTAAVVLGRRKAGNPAGLMQIYALGLVTVGAIGYFGGELVYGRKPAPIPMADPQVQQGAALFTQNCAFCHLTDRTDGKVGPGLKGLYGRETLAGSGWPVDDTHVRRQLVAPFKEMPPFAQLPPEQLDALVAYLKTL